MKKDNFETIYLYKIYELEFEESNMDSKQLINYFDQLTTFLFDYTSIDKTVNEEQGRTLIDGIFDYFKGHHPNFKSTLSDEIIFGISAFMAVFSECKDTGNGVEEYLQQNKDVQMEIKRKIEWLRDKEQEQELEF